MIIKEKKFKKLTDKVQKNHNSSKNNNKLK